VESSAVVKGKKGAGTCEPDKILVARGGGGNAGRGGKKAALPAAEKVVPSKGPRKSEHPRVKEGRKTEKALKKLSVN